MNLKIDPEFQRQIPPLTDEEKSMLERQLMQDGCRDPLVVWGMTILDGHNRYEICNKHGIVYDIHSMDFPDREAAMDWIDRNQIGRRNLPKDDFRLIVGRIYNRTKKAVTDGGKGTPKATGDQKEHRLKTAEVIAKDFGVSPVSVRRYGKLAEAVDTIQQQQPEIERGDAIEAAKEITRPNKPKAKGVTPKEKPRYEVAMKFARMAVMDLREIHHSDPDKEEAFDYVIEWIKKNR